MEEHQHGNHNSQNKEKDNENNRKRKNLELCLAISSIIISLISITFTLIYNLSPGKIIPHRISGYSILRGVSHFPSDHIVLPIEWENSGGKNVIIYQPKLLLYKIVEGENQNAEPDIIFSLAGEYSNISPKSISDEYIIERSFTLSPHDITTKVLLFHIENWWNDKHTNYCFNFKEGESYITIIEYSINNKVYTKEIGTINVYGGINHLEYNSSYWWDFWESD